MITKDQIKKHYEKHKVIYNIVGGTLFFSAGIFVGKKLGVKVPQIINTVAPVISPDISPVFNNSNNMGGYSHKIVQRLEDGKIWASAKECAEEIGATPSVLSKVLNGHTDHFDDLHYVIIGLGISA